MSLLNKLSLFNNNNKKNNTEPKGLNSSVNHKKPEASGGSLRLIQQGACAVLVYKCE